MSRAALILSLVGVIIVASSAFSQSSTDTEAKLLSMPEVVLSPEAVAAGIDGQLAVAVSVGKDGTVDRARVLGGPSWPCESTPKREIQEVRESVVAAAKNAKFSPEMKDGKPQSAEVIITVLIGQRLENYKKWQTLRDKAASGQTGMVKGGVINGKALSLPKPDYPSGARPSRASGAVFVDVVIDEQGSVVKAGAISGIPLFHDAARTAACRAKFSPTQLYGQLVRVHGVITYNFVP